MNTTALKAAKSAARQRHLDNPPAPAPQPEIPPAMPEEPKLETVSEATICTASESNPPLDVEAMILKIKEHSIQAFAGIGHMIKAGELLLTLKRALPHGQFIKMSMEGTGLSRSTIGRYMQMAENVSRVGHLKSGRDALETITKLNEPTPPPAPRQSPGKVKGSPFAGSPVQDAEIVENNQHDEVDEPALVIDESKKTSTPTGWCIAREFIERLKRQKLSPEMERGGLCDMRDYIDRRLKELTDIADAEAAAKHNDEEDEP